MNPEPIILPNGIKCWGDEDFLHREDGPAIERANGRKAWYLYGDAYTEEEFNSDEFQMRLVHGA